MMRKILSTLMMAAAAGTACAQKDNGNFTYFLPKTEVSISLLIEKTTYTPEDLPTTATCISRQRHRKSRK